MVTRIGGLASGMDIDELVKKLMTAEKAPLNKLYQKKQIYEWQRDSYRSVNTKLNTFDTYIADNFILKNIGSKTANLSNSDFISATATSKASGTLSIEGVSQLATAASSVGEQKNATGSTKLSELGIKDGIINLKAIKSDGTMPEEGTKIEIDSSMTVSQFVTKINNSNAGVSALFENGRLSITAKNTGNNKQGAEVKVSEGADIFGKLGFTALEGKSAGDLASGGTNAIFKVNGITTERSTNTFSISGYTVTLKNTFNQAATVANSYNAAYKEWDFATNKTDFKALEKAINQAKDTYDTANNKYTEKLNQIFGNSTLSNDNKGIYNKINNKNLLASLSQEEMTEIRNLQPDTSSQEAFDSWLKNATISRELKQKLTGLKTEQFTTLQSLDDDKFQNMKNAAQLEIYNSIGPNFFNGLGTNEINQIKSITNLSTEEFNTNVNQLKNSPEEWKRNLGKKLSSLSESQRESLSKLTTEDLSKFAEVGKLETEKENALLGIDEAKATYDAAIERQKSSEGALKDAYLAFSKVNGSIGNVNPDDLGSYPPTVDVPSNSVNPVTITSSTNVDEMMDKIKEYVKTYNGLIADLTSQTKEKKYRDYAPLTNEQKEEMSENEIKIWEEKAKSGLLKSDSILRNGLSSMRSLVYETNYGVDNPKYNALYKVGITTTKSYSDGGMLEIDEVKLRKALEDDPDAVVQLLSNSEGKKEDTVTIEQNGEMVTKKVDTRGYLQQLRGSMKEFQLNIEKKAGRSTMVDHQYSIGKNILDADNRIDNWKRKLEDIEARYWKQFTAMEQAINKANSQSSYFAQFSGQ